MADRKSKEVEDAFYGGMCAALSLVAVHGHETCYEEIVALCPTALERFAKKNQDIELPNIRKAIRFNRSRGSTPSGPRDPASPSSDNSGPAR